MIISLFIIFILKFSNAQKKFILVSNEKYLSECETGKSDTKFTGLLIELFNKVAENLKWNSSDWEYSCVNDTDYSSQLINFNHTIAYISNHREFSQTYDENLLYTEPIIDTGVSILVWRENDKWLFIKVFTLEVGFLIIGTAIFIGILHFFFEKKNYSLSEYLWNTFSALFFINQIRLYRISSRLTILCFWLIALVVTASYTANLTSITTVEADAKKIKNVHQLSKKKVKANLENIEKLYFYGAQVYKSYDGGYKYTDRISENMILADFNREDAYKMDGIAVNDVFASIMEQKYCEIYKVAPFFMPYSMSLIYSKNLDTTLVAQINKAIYDMKTQKNPQIIQKEYIDKNYKQCRKVTNSNKIGVKDMEGLWIILAASVGISILVFIFTKTDLFKKKVMPFLIKYKVITEQIDQQKLIGDDLLIANIKEICQGMLNKAEESVKGRLEFMEENIMKFYEDVFSNTNDFTVSNDKDAFSLKTKHD